MVFVGVQPSFTQVPPTCLRSINAVCMPAPARAVESGVPACPAPMMMASYCAELVICRFVAGDSPGKCVGGDALSANSLSESRNQKQAEPDGDQIFRNGDGEVRSMEGPHQSDSCLFARESADHATDSSR